MTLPKHPLKPIPKKLPPLRLVPKEMGPLSTEVPKTSEHWVLQGTMDENPAWAVIMPFGEPGYTRTPANALTFANEWSAESFKCRASLYRDFVPVKVGGV